MEDMKEMLEENPDSEFVPAGRLVLMRYRTRLMRRRFAIEDKDGVMQQLIREVLDAQQKKADQTAAASAKCQDEIDHGVPYNEILQSIRASIGYFDGAEKVGSVSRSRKAKWDLRFPWLKIKQMRKQYDEKAISQMYYDTCVFAISLEDIATDYLQGVCQEGDQRRKEAAEILLEEHRAALYSLKSRIDFKEGHTSPDELKENIRGQFQMARIHAEEADANGLNMELDQIRHLRVKGTISESEARGLREEVYLMQTSFL